MVSRQSIKNFLQQTYFLLSISHSHDILRRYFIVNGFDGSLTMLGIIIGFGVSNTTDLTVTINACIGAAIGLGVSGVSSAYVTEHAEHLKAFKELEAAMLIDLETSEHGQAKRWVPFLLAVVNGGSPFIISLLIIAPLWLAKLGVYSFISPLILASIVAFAITFILGIILGHISGISWFMSGLKTLMFAVIAVILIYLFSQ